VKEAHKKVSIEMSLAVCAYSRKFLPGKKSSNFEHGFAKRKYIKIMTEIRSSEKSVKMRDKVKVLFLGARKRISY